MKQITIPERALRLRLRRHLAKQDRAIRRADGRDVLVDSKKGVVSDPIDLVKLGRDLGVLRAWERLR